MSTNDKNQAITAALQALLSYDQFGTIPNHKSVMRSLLTCMHDNDDFDCVVNKDPILVALSNRLTLHAIEKAKK